MSNEVNETKVFQSVQDISQTQTIPMESEDGETKVFESVADGSETQVLPTADDEQQTQVLPTDGQADGQPEADTIALQSVADMEESADAEKLEGTAAEKIPAASEPAAKPDLNVPLTEAFAQPEPAQSEPAQSEPVQSEPVQPKPQDTQAPKRGASIPTVIFGVLGMLIGVVGLAFGWAFPGLLIESFYIDPRVLIAVICGAMGVILVLVAIIWAVMGSAKKKQRSSGQ